MLLSNRVCWFFLLLVGCGDSANPQGQKASRSDKVPMQCVLTGKEIQDLQLKPLALIHRVIVTEPGLEKKPFAESFTLWQACYQTF